MTTFERKERTMFFIDALKELAKYPYQRAFICLQGEDEGYFFNEQGYLYSLSKGQEQAFGELSVDITKNQLLSEKDWELWVAITPQEEELVRIDMGD